MAKRTSAYSTPLQPLAPVRPPLRVLILYACGQLGWSLASFGVGNLLIYFYMPPEQGQAVFPPFIYQGPVLGVLTLIGLLSAGGRLFDAVIDPLLANWSDNASARIGKRRWFMLWGPCLLPCSASWLFIRWRRLSAAVILPGWHWYCCCFTSFLPFM
ncbi:MAG: MFS transporter [Saprospiraceae bacterium]